MARVRASSLPSWPIPAGDPFVRGPGPYGDPWHKSSLFAPTLTRHGTPRWTIEGGIARRPRRLRRGRLRGRYAAAPHRVQTEDADRLSAGRRLLCAPGLVLRQGGGRAAARGDQGGFRHTRRGRAGPPCTPTGSEHRAWTCRTSRSTWPVGWRECRTSRTTPDCSTTREFAPAGIAMRAGPLTRSGAAGSAAFHPYDHSAVAMHGRGRRCVQRLPGPGDTEA